MQSLNTTPYQENHNNIYIMNHENKIESIRLLEKAQVIKYKDGTEWVVLTNKKVERFCGFLYLQNEINESKLNSIKAAENKIAIYKEKIIYLSRYCGDEKINQLKLCFVYGKELSVLDKAKFRDMAYSSNLREKNGTIYVFDTEKNSFDKSVHEKIDAFVHQHDSILSILKEGVHSKEPDMSSSEIANQKVSNNQQKRKLEDEIDDKKKKVKMTSK